MKKDLIVAFSIFLFVLGGGYVIKKNILTSYAWKEEEKLNIETKSLVDNANLALEKLDNNNESYEDLVKTNYSLIEVYDSIKALNNGNLKTLKKEFIDIYVNFYKYFDKSNLFYNMYQESYNFDEYEFVINNHIMRNEKEIFALYLTTYTKCQIFSMFDDERFNKDNYCLE